MSRSTRAITVALSYSSVVDDSQQPSPLGGGGSKHWRRADATADGVAVSAVVERDARMPHAGRTATRRSPPPGPRGPRGLVHQAQHRVARADALRTNSIVLSLSA